MRRPPDPQLLGFLKAYDRHISDLALALRELVLDESPDASEPRLPARSIAADPNRVLEGDGKTMRHIKFASLADVERPFVRRYSHAAMEQAAPAGTRGTGKSVVIARNAERSNRKTRAGQSNPA